MTQKGKLYLIPTVISDQTHQDVIPMQVREALGHIQYFLAENIRTARRYLSALKVYESIEPLHFETLDKNTQNEALPGLFAPIFQGHHVGVLSESGCPGIADPGALAVQYAHENEISVIPLVGPSSILLALMGSGLNGQQFAFHGYLPINAQEAALVIKKLEKESRAKNQTQVFIETPYRNKSIFQNLLANLDPEVRLTIALDLTGPLANIQTLKVREWKKKSVEWPKLPSVFLFLAAN